MNNIVERLKISRYGFTSVSAKITLHSIKKGTDYMKLHNISVGNITRNVNSNLATKCGQDIYKVNQNLWHDTFQIVTLEIRGLTSCNQINWITYFGFFLIQNPIHVI
jgi:hypothetical protein